MALAVHSSAPLPEKKADRLHGWKEISAYLGRGVRTAQRWERELGLPIYRLVTKNAEVVYARRSEIDNWWNSTDRLRAAPKTDTPSALPSISVLRRSVTRLDLGWAALAIAVLVVMLMGSANSVIFRAWPFASPSAPGAQPVSWRIDHQRLQVFDALGNPLWEHAFEFPIDEGVYRTGFLADGQSPTVAIDDVDGDGEAEVLMVPWAAAPGNRRLYCFRANGMLAFVAPAAGGALGGLSLRDQGFNADRFIVSGEAGGAKSIWLSVPHYYRPQTVVQRLDGRGRLTSEYRSNGIVTLLKELSVQGRRLLMVGGSNAALQSATLAMLDYGDAAGSDPMAGGAPACEGCSTATPIAFLTFPRLDVAAAVSRQPLVNTVHVRGDGGLDVSVLQARLGAASDRPFVDAAVVYSFSADLRVESAVVTEGYLLAHSELQMAGSLAHPRGRDDARTLFPLSAWQRDRFVPLPAGAAVPLDR